MLKTISVVSMITVLGTFQAKAQAVSYLDGIFIDQQLYRTCMASRGNEGFCNCMFEVSNKNLTWPKFKKIWLAYQANKTPDEANRMRTQLTPDEIRLIDGQLRAADNAQNACNARFGVR